MGIAGMVLGIIGVIFAFIPVIGAFISFPCIAVGLPLSVVGFVRNRKREQGTGMAVAGIATNTVALVVVIVWLVAVGAAVSEVSESMGSGSDTSLPSVPAFGGIDKSVKDNVAFTGSRPTDEEIRLACGALRKAGWDYMSIDPLATGTRSMMIAAAINTYASGSRLVDYCNSK